MVSKRFSVSYVVPFVILLGHLGGYGAEAADPTCVNGITSGLFCCLAGCDTCGGSECYRRNGLNCCTGTITNSCETNNAPCKMESAPVQAEVQPQAITPSDPTCFNGVASGLFCCVPGCGTCGGSRCNSRNGLNCCTGTITRSCTSSVAPCKMASLPVTDPTCANGVKTNGYCCWKECGTCGSSACATRVSGIDCCTRSIAITCNLKTAPCLVSGRTLQPLSGVAWNNFSLQTWIDANGDGRGDLVSADRLSSEVSKAFFGGVDSQNRRVQSFATPVAGLPYGTAPRPRTELRQAYEWNALTGRHVLSARLKLMHIPHMATVVVAQIMQKQNSDTIYVVNIYIRYNLFYDNYYSVLTINAPYSKTGARATYNLSNQSQDVVGVELNYSIVVDRGVLSCVYSDGNGNSFSTGPIKEINWVNPDLSGQTTGFAFKAGNYLQTTHDKSNPESSTVWYYDITTSHT